MMANKNNILSIHFSKKINIILYLIAIRVFINNKYEYNKKFKIPKVSVFLPIYNKQAFLIRSINSILRQTLKEIEIIAVNDCSTDNSLKKIKKMAKKDNRIKIINNDRNHGLLYSRAMGILNCTGDYIMNLDPDDQLSSKYDLEFLYRKAKKFKTDIIIFRLKKKYTNKLNEFKNKKTRFLLNNNSTLQKWQTHNLITNKFIKRNIILKVYNYYKKNIYKYKWNYGEDNIWSILIKKTSNSIIYINKKIYIYFKNQYSLMHNGKNDLQSKNLLYRFEKLKILYKIKKVNAAFRLLNKTKDTIKRDLEFRKRMKRLLIYYMNFYKKHKLKLTNIKNIIQLISNKIIIVIDSDYNKYKFNNNFIYICKILKKFSKKTIISVDINMKRDIDFHDYVFNNDIFLFYNDSLIYSKFEELMNLYPKNIFVILTTNIGNFNYNNFTNLIILVENINISEKSFLFRNKIFNNHNLVIYSGNLFKSKNNILIIYNKRINNKILCELLISASKDLFNVTFINTKKYKL